MYVLSAELSTRSIHLSKPKNFVISRSNTRVLFRLALVKTQRFTKDCSQKLDAPLWKFLSDQPSKKPSMMRLPESLKMAKGKFVESIHCNREFPYRMLHSMRSHLSTRLALTLTSGISTSKFAGNYQPGTSGHAHCILSVAVSWEWQSGRTQKHDNRFRKIGTLRMQELFYRMIGLRWVTYLTCSCTFPPRWNGSNGKSTQIWH